MAKISLCMYESLHAGWSTVSKNCVLALRFEDDSSGPCGRWLSLMFYVGIAADHVGFTSAHPMIMKKHVYHEMHTMSIDSETLATLQVPSAQLDYREEFDRGEAPYVLRARRALASCTNTWSIFFVSGKRTS